MIRPGDDVAHVHADPARIEQVIVDLVLHARSAMPSGGTLTVETASVDFSRNGSDSNGAGRHAMLAISDTGSETGDERGERLGLGLATVYGVSSTRRCPLLIRSRGFLDRTLTTIRGRCWNHR